MVKLIKLEIEGFGKFDKKKIIDFKKGINFITGLNEAGKSTILEAILASVFKYTTTKIKPFICWTNHDTCKLALTYETDKGETFQILSDYKNSKRKLIKITKSGQSEISTTISTINEYIKKHFGFDEQKVFENTTFIRQSQMAVLNDDVTKNKLRDMVEEVLVGSAKASATKAVKNIKKITKSSEKEASTLSNTLRELKSELHAAEDNKNKLTQDSEEHETTNAELKAKSEKLKKLKGDRKLFDEKEVLLKDQQGVDENIKRVDDMIETLDDEKEKPTHIKQSKTSSIVLIVLGALLSLTLIGAIIGIPLIIYGVRKLGKKNEAPPKVQGTVSDKVIKYKNQKKDLINKKAVLESKLENYKLVKFSLDDFRDLEKLDQNVEKLKSKSIELRTSINTTKQLVKSPEELTEDVDATEIQIKDLLEKSEDHELASFFLEKAEKEVQQKFTPSIETDSKDILKKVTNGKYSDLRIGEEDLTILVKAPEINEFIPVDLLSQGAKDQIYFTIRTTLAELLSGSINLPLVFDDPFHNFDDIRLRKTISAVKELSKTKQIILISHKNYQKDYRNFADNVIEV